MGPPLLGPPSEGRVRVGTRGVQDFACWTSRLQVHRKVNITRFETPFPFKGSGMVRKSGQFRNEHEGTGQTANDLH